MMKRNFKQLFFALIFIVNTGGGLFGQVNLFRNPSFEDRWQCIYRVGTRFDTVYSIAHWTTPLFQDPSTTATPTYPTPEDSCNYRWRAMWWTDVDTIPARTGRRFGSLITSHYWRTSNEITNDLRFYIQTKLAQPLEKDEKYYVEMYMRRSDRLAAASWGTYATNGQGIAFTEEPTRYDPNNNSVSGNAWYAGALNTNGILIQNRDSVMRDTNWQRISACFEARGKEQFATFGNFLTLANTNRVIMRDLPLGSTGDRGYEGHYDVEDVKIFKLRIGIPKDTAICEGDTLVLDVRRNVPVSRTWSDNAGEDSIKRITKPGKYTLYTNYNRNALGCVQEESINVTVVPKQIGTRAFDTVGCDNKIITLKAGFGVRDEVVTWQDSSKSPTLKVNRANNYWAQVRNFCVSYTDTFRVKYENCAISVFAPNAFSPNGDATNDVFKPYVNQARNVVVTDYELRLFNRWGEQVFQTKDLAQGWDGKFLNQDAPNAVYVWVITLKADFNGDPVDRVFSGDVSLLR
jgi:gliding motility-associated-like protein